jgi:hypothetical protein
LKVNGVDIITGAGAGCMRGGISIPIPSWEASGSTISRVDLVPGIVFLNVTLLFSSGKSNALNLFGKNISDVFGGTSYHLESIFQEEDLLIFTTEGKETSSAAIIEESSFQVLITDQNNKEVLIESVYIEFNIDFIY